MGYVRTEFENSLVIALSENNQIATVEGASLSAVEILATDPTLHDEVYSDWKLHTWFPEHQNRVNSLKSFGSNAVRLDELVKQLTSKHAPIPLVGSGVGCASGLPTWTDLLRQLQPKSTLLSRDLEKMISLYQYEEAAGAIYDNMHTNLFAEQCEVVLNVSERAIRGAVLLLPVLFNGPVLTLNFDELLESLYREAGEGTGISFQDVIMGSHFLSESDDIDLDSHVLIKLHGTVRERSSLILTKAKYDEYYSEAHPYQSRIKKIMSSRPLLFIGCSLVKDRFMELLGSSQTGFRSYAFLSHPGDDAKIRSRENELAAFNVFPIWYGTMSEAMGHNIRHDLYLESLLAYLIEKSGKLDLV